MWSVAAGVSKELVPGASVRGDRGGGQLVKPGRPLTPGVERGGGPPSAEGGVPVNLAVRLLMATEADSAQSSMGNCSWSSFSPAPGGREGGREGEGEGERERETPLYS